MFKHILVPTDGSTLSDDTVERALSFAAEANARITFLYVRPDYPIAYFGEGALIDPTTSESFAEITAKNAEEILARAAKAATEAKVSHTTRAVVNDLPYEAIIAEATASACDLIFMASHGRRGLSSLLLGSETHKVLTHSSIPVLVYRQPNPA